MRRQNRILRPLVEINSAILIVPRWRHVVSDCLLQAFPQRVFKSDHLPYLTFAPFGGCGFHPFNQPFNPEL